MEPGKVEAKVPLYGIVSVLEVYEEEFAPLERKVNEEITACPGTVPTCLLYTSTLSDVDIQAEIRFSTGMGELNRVLGGGAVAGSLVLVGGAPGIGKSTLLLQICACRCKERRVVYASGEESERQLKLRAQRLNVDSENLLILSETRLGDILEAVEECKPDVLIADSIQTLYSESNESAPGSISQVKDCTMSMMQLAKGKGITAFVVGHITKEAMCIRDRLLT